MRGREPFNVRDSRTIVKHLQGSHSIKLSGHSRSAPPLRVFSTLRKQRHAFQVEVSWSNPQETRTKSRFPGCLVATLCVSIFGIRELCEGRLRGDQLLGGASGPKPTCDPPVAALDVSHLKGTDGPLVADREDQFNPNLAVIGPAWAKAGCYEDSPKFPTVVGANQPYYDNSGLSVTSCTTRCGKSNKKAAAMMKRSGTWVSTVLLPRRLVRSS
jgi:hypothetical protein